MGEKPKECPVCKDVDKLTYNVTRWGTKESYLRQRTFSGTAWNCPECGRKLRG